MTPDEIDYQEAVRRILEAEETGATSLDLSEITSLRRLPPEGTGTSAATSPTNLTALREIAPQS